MLRAQRPTVRPVAVPPEPAHFDGPADPFVAESGGGTEAVLDPFSVYRKGEALLRRQLSALAGCVNVNM